MPTDDVIRPQRQRPVERDYRRLFVTESK
jgi:hypothetical protein